MCVCVCDAAGGVAGGSGGGLAVEAGGVVDFFSFFMMDYKDWGVQPGGRGFDQATEDRPWAIAGTGPSGGRTR